MSRIKHSHNCENTTCENIASKDKYGNYKQYCSSECKKITQLAKMQTSLANKDMNAIKEKRKTFWGNFKKEKRRTFRGNF